MRRCVSVCVCGCLCVYADRLELNGYVLRRRREALATATELSENVKFNAIILLYFFRFSSIRLAVLLGSTADPVGAFAHTHGAELI